MSDKEVKTGNNPWLWIPSLYFTEGLPYIAIMVVSGIMYKTLGISNTEFAFYTAWLYLPWVIKPFWSPLVELYKTKRYWIVLTQFFMGICFALVAFLLPTTLFFQSTLAMFWLLAFSSATHDIAADGFYIINLDEYQQSWFVGIRSTFYRLAMIIGQGIIVMLVGFIENSTGVDSVNIEVHAKDIVKQSSEPVLKDVKPINKPFSGKLRVLTLTGNKIDIPLGITDSKSVASIVKKSKHLDDVSNKTVATTEDLSLFQQFIVPIEEYLREHFGESVASKPTEKAGNIGCLFFQLSKPPKVGENIIVNVSKKSGSGNISLIAGGCTKFNAKNWNNPFILVFQIDPKQDSECSAIFELRSGNTVFAWSVSFVVLAIFFIIIALYHMMILPEPENITTQHCSFFDSFRSFFAKKGVGLAIIFLLIYRLGESQLVKLTQPFMLDPKDVGGLAFTTAEVGFIYGTVGTIMLAIGGVIGGIVAARYGLRKVIYPMAIAMNLPNVVYLYLAYYQPDNFALVNVCVAFEQFGYGFGFTAFMLFMVSFVEDSGKYRTSHFSIMTGFMAMGMMFPMMLSGWVQDIVGYKHFFIWVLFATIPGFIAIRFIPISRTFGIKHNAK